MKKESSLLILLLIAFNFIFAQKTITSKIIEPFQKDALFREKVFLHLNKTIYFTNENVWFTAYVVDDENNTPSFGTSNLYVNLLNENGDVIEQKIVFIEDGKGSNEFFVGEKLNSGTYYIQGFTNYMKNFGEDNVFLQKIEIRNTESESIVQRNNNLNTTPIPIVKESNNHINYDIQLFPESGYLLSNVMNTIGVKVLVNGKWLPFQGEIVNSKDKTIVTFIGNDFGMCKTGFYYVENETYTVLININNTVQRVPLQNALETGIIFNMDAQSYKDLVKLTLITNKKSLFQLSNKKLAIVFYRNNHISEAVSLNLINAENTIQELFFDKDKMLNGVNTVTLFSDYKPIAERKFFIDKTNEETTILLNKINKDNDSIVYSIKTINHANIGVSSKLSISVMPKETKTFFETQNIKSGFLLTPYVKGNIENPSFYLNNKNKKAKDYLDILLLNQGWTTYSLEEKINEVNPKIKNEWENGFTIKGEINKIPKGYDKLVLFNESIFNDFCELNTNNEFIFNNIFTYKNEVKKIALIRNGKQLAKPSKINLNEIPKSTPNFKELIPSIGEVPEVKLNSKPKSSSEIQNVSDFTGYPKMERLNEVRLNTVFSKKKESFYDKEAKLAYKHKISSAGSYQSKKITEQLEISFVCVLDYLRSLGYVKGIGDTERIRLRNTRVTIVGGSTNMDPKVFIDNYPLATSTIKETLKFMLMSDVDEILINKSGAGGGIDGVGGIIRIYRKKGNYQYFEEEGENLYEELIMLTGFNKANDYYKPQYNIYTKDAYNWSEIDWKNDIQTNEKGEAIFKVPINEFSNEYQFIINGFSNDGLLFNTNSKSNLNNF